MLCCAKSPQLCPTLCNSMDYNPPGSFVHGILQARILEWVAMPSSRGSFWPRDQTCLSHVSCIGRWTLNHQHHLSSVAQSCPTLCDPMNHSTPGLPVQHQLPEFTQTQVHWVSEAIQPSHHLSSLSPPALNLSQHQRLYSKESALRIRWPKYWSFSFNISPSNEHPGLISFRMDWLDLLAVQRTLKSLLQHHSSKASILWHSAFFTGQLSHLYMTTAIALQLNNSAWACRTPALSQSPAFVNKHIGAQPHPFISVLPTVAHVLQHEKWVAMTEITSLNYVPSGPLRKGLLTSASK